jgi:hypothetical protein
MLSRIKDWYLIVNPQPTDEVIEQRKDAAARVVKQVGAPNVVFSCVELAMLEQPRAPSATLSACMDLVGECIRHGDPTFSNDHQGNALELRVLAAVALGEIISAATALDSHSLGAAALALAAVSCRTLPSGRHLRRMLEDLVRLATEALSNAGTQARHKSEPRLPEKLATVDAAALETLRKSASELAALRRVDREDVDVLGWIVRRYSRTTQEALDVLAPGARALVAGTELADFVLIPPPPNSAQTLASLVGHADTVPLTITSVVSSLPEHFWALLQPIGDLPKQCPRVLALSYLGTLRPASVATDWARAFEEQTSLPTDTSALAITWARQAFTERIAQRLLAEKEA